MSTDIASLLHARDGQRERCPWCRRELADETDDRLCIDAAEADGRSVGGEGTWLCWAEFSGGWGCDSEEADAQRERAEKAERRVTELTAAIAVTRAEFGKIWPNGSACEHRHAAAGFKALEVADG